MLNSSLDAILHDARFLIPEMVFAGILVMVILLDLIFRRAFYKLLPAALSIVLLGSILYWTAKAGATPPPQPLFFHSLLFNAQSVYFKILFDLATLILFLYGMVGRASGGSHRFYKKTEFYCIVWVLLIGLHLLAMASSLLTVYLAFEMVSIGGYLLAAFGFNSRSAEASVKYLLFGAVSSGIMLYGMSLLYGLTGTLTFPGVFHGQQAMTLIALLITFAGIFFKIAASPFHLWSPDVYEGIPAPLSAYFSIAPKAGGFVLLMNVLAVNFENALTQKLSLFLAFIAIITIAVGNFSALWQQNAKRMLAYSSIAHTGFALGGLAVLSPSGAQACLYYLAIYLFMNFAAFLMVDFLAEQLGSEDVNKFKGLGMQVPLIGVIFVFIMIALTGLPPTAGFYAKFFVFSAMWESYSLSSNSIFLLLFIFGLFNTVVSLVYYLKIPYLMFFKAPGSGIPIQSTFLTNTFFCLLAVPLLVLFLKPDLLFAYINFVFK
jgi:NADH-quinone oxidoreductase subunit N